MVTAPNDIIGLRQLWKLAFGDTEEFLDKFFSTAFAPERCHVLKQEGQIVAALYRFDCSMGEQKLAYLYAVATHPDFRGQGLCRRLMGQTHGMLKEQGYDGVLLVPQDGGLRKMYAAMGYQDATSVAEFSCEAGEALPMAAVDADAYATLRRKFLPEKGVVQEGENLRFLDTYACFYQGSDFLAAVSGKQIVELLGNRRRAAGIFAALGLEGGDVRTAGEEVPYAMFLPLTEWAQMPAYFGLAFD